jgi:hypothetical protein
VFKIKIGRSERFQEIMEDFVHNVRNTHGLTFAVAATSIVFLLAARHAKRRFKSIKMLPEALVLVSFFFMFTLCIGNVTDVVLFTSRWFFTSSSPNSPTSTPKESASSVRFPRGSRRRRVSWAMNSASSWVPR